ncbi:MAG: MFS transporter, partial [Marmoricola sp.]
LLGAVLLALLGVANTFMLALVILIFWGLIFAAVTPIRQAYLNDLIPSAQRATVLSFDSLMGSTGGVVIQPLLGRSADLWGYGGSYLVGAAVQALAIPFLFRSRAEKADADIRTTPSAQAPV